MTQPLSDDNLRHLRILMDQPDLGSTKYELVRKLGSGGMASVFLVRDRELDRQVALKVVTLAEKNVEFTERMVREAKIVARLEHPNIVPIHDVGVLADDRTYYVMKYVEGVTLENFVLQGHNRNDLLRIFQKVCDALAFAHSIGIIHRDLKPTNIMIGSFGEALVMDWGIAAVIKGPDSEIKPIASDSAHSELTTSHGTILGTAAYMSPEQAGGEIEQVDVRSDIYSLGAVLYFMLNAKEPRAGNSADAYQQGQTGESLVALRRTEPGIPKSLNAICLKAMAFRPSGRYQSCSELAADVSRFLDQLPVTAYRENVFERLARWANRNKIILLIVAGYILVRFLIFLRAGI